MEACCHIIPLASPHSLSQFLQPIYAECNQVGQSQAWGHLSPKPLWPMIPISQLAVQSRCLALRCYLQTCSQLRESHTSFVVATMLECSCLFIIFLWRATIILAYSSYLKSLLVTMVIIIGGLLASKMQHISALSKVIYHSSHLF